MAPALFFLYFRHNWCLTFPLQHLSGLLWLMKKFTEKNFEGGYRGIIKPWGAAELSKNAFNLFLLTASHVKAVSYSPWKTPASLASFLAVPLLCGEKVLGAWPHFYTVPCIIPYIFLHVVTQNTITKKQKANHWSTI